MQLTMIGTNSTESVCQKIILGFVMLYWNGFAIFTVADIFKQCNCMKLYMKLGKSATLEILCQLFGKYSLHPA